MDGERTAVYAAELMAFDGTDLETLQSLDSIVDAVRSVSTGEWWPGPVVTCVAARRDARSSSARRCGADSDATVLRFAAAQLTVATAAHELAHALAGPEHGHDSVFRAALLDVVGVITNLATSDRRLALHTEQLGDAFVAANLGVGRRQWPAPSTAASGGAIAL